MTIDRSIQAATFSARRLLVSHSYETVKEFDEHLLEIVRYATNIDTCFRIESDMPGLRDFLSACTSLLLTSSAEAPTRSKIHLCLFNLAFHNISIRQIMAGGVEMDVCGPLFHSLQNSIQEQLGPQNVIDILRALQVVTYDPSLALGSWTNAMISFLLNEVCRPDEQEWLPYCMGIICNLASRSKSVCLRIQKSSSYKSFCKMLIKLLAHDSRMVVVSALVLVAYLEEKLRDTVFCQQNIEQTFQCVFNVVILGDFLLTRNIAVDLLRRMITAEPGTLSSEISVTAIGKDIAQYKFYRPTIRQIAGLLVQIDVRCEEVLKVYEFLEMLCLIKATSRTTIETVLNMASAAENPLKTPMMAICRTSAMHFHDPILPDVVLVAIRFLTVLVKEIIECGSKLQDFVSTSALLRVIECGLKTPIDARKPAMVVFQCKRATNTLKLVEVLSNDDDIRNDLLQIVTAALCAHLAETELLTNPIIPQLNKLPAQRTETLPAWSGEGVTMVLGLLRVLAALKDYSKPHKDEYWKLLKDERILPLLAFAIVAGRPHVVHDAMLLYTHCAQVHAFPTHRLADLIANCIPEFQLANDRETSLSRSHHGSLQRRELRSYKNVGDMLKIGHASTSSQMVNGHSPNEMDMSDKELGRCTKLEFENLELKSENQREREMQAALRERYNEMKRNFDKITLNLVDCEGQVQALAAEKLTSSKSLENLSSQLAMERNLRQSLETNLSAQTTKLLNMEENETRKVLHARQREQETEELRLENARLKTELEKANTLRGELVRLMNKM